MQAHKGTSMINLSIDEVDRIRRICGDLDINYFTLTQDTSSGIGSTLTLSYDTELKGYAVNITMQVTGSEDW
jgi:hypothetical protein